MRNALCRNLPELSAPIAWQAREWLLVKSEQTSGGSVYAPVGRWSLE
jgi:2'-5' RNA ligase